MGAITITKDEFETLIEEVSVQTGADWEYADEDGVGEYVYYLETRELPDQVVVRICSTVNTYTDESRGDGEDSIKTMLWHLGEEQPIAGRSYTKRIETWKKNLQPKVLDCLAEWREMITFCPNCSVPMVIRNGRSGPFLGCPNYPDCEETENL